MQAGPYGSVTWDKVKGKIKKRSRFNRSHTLINLDVSKLRELHFPSVPWKSCQVYEIYPEIIALPARDLFDCQLLVNSRQYFIFPSMTTPYMYKLLSRGYHWESLKQ